MGTHCLMVSYYADFRDHNYTNATDRNQYYAICM